MGCTEGRSPFDEGTGVSPVFGFITPFLARKGAGGMVEGLWGTNDGRIGGGFEARAVDWRKVGLGGSLPAGAGAADHGAQAAERGHVQRQHAGDDKDPRGRQVQEHERGQGHDAPNGHE